MPNGYIAVLACGPLKKKRWINEKIEVELIEFKAEIASKFSKSQMNKEFKFPRKKPKT